MMLSTMMPMMLLCVQAQVLISMPVTVDGVARDLKLMQGETVAMAAEVFDGSITDLYLPKKK